jgi:hypothetical protein
MPLPWEGPSDEELDQKAEEKEEHRRRDPEEDPEALDAEMDRYERQFGWGRNEL